MRGVMETDSHKGTLRKVRWQEQEKRIQHQRMASKQRGGAKRNVASSTTTPRATGSATRNAKWWSTSPSVRWLRHN